MTIRKQVEGEMAEIGAEWISENPTIELQDRHPTSGGYVNGTNNDNLTGLDAAFPNAPLRIWAPGVRLATL